MAAASPSPLAASTETTNGVKLRRLLVDGGTTVLRKVLDGIHPPTKLAANLHLNNSTLDDLFATGILSEQQRNLLFPPDGSKPDSKTFDITLLFLLLTETCGISPPARTGWNHKPQAKNKSLAANLVRIKLFRNKLLHTPETRIDSRLFNELWKEISSVLVSLGLDQAEINRLKIERCGEEDYLDVLFKWADREKEVKSMVEEVRQSQNKMQHTQQEHQVLLEVVCKTEQEHLTLLQDANVTLKQAHETQQRTKSKLEAIRQSHAKTQETVVRVHHTQLQDHETLQDNKSKLDEVHQTQTKTQETVERVHHAQLEDRETLQKNKSKLDEVHQTQTKTRQTVERVHLTQLEDRETLHDNKSKLEALHKTQSKAQDSFERFRQVQLKDHETLQDSKSRLDALYQTQTNTQETVAGVVKSQEELVKSFEEVKQAVCSLKEGRDEVGSEVLRNLAKSEFKGDIEYHVGRYQEGTREWVFNEVQNWLDNRNSKNRVMVISSNAGMGKSVISAVICKRMQDDGRLSGSHFCQHNSSRYRNPQLMLQSLACHLCHALPEYKQALVKQMSRNLGKDLNNMGVEELFGLLFKEPLGTVADPGRNMLMVIDGLDESDYQERNELLDVIANQLSKLPCWIRFLCTTRPERNISEALKHLKPFQLKSNDVKNMDDIKCLIENRTQHLIKPEKKGAIVERLVAKSEGLMLYAYFLVLFIQENKPVLDQEDLDDSLPLAISSAYHSYFKRLENELKKELGVNEENFLNLLSAVIASREPLPIDFVSRLLGSNASSRLARRKVLRVISSVSSLLPIRDGCLHVIHKSVKDWLTDSSCYGEHDFTMDEKEGHRILARLCGDELDHLKQKGVRDAQFSSTEKYALHHGVRHMLQVDENVILPSLEECVQTYVIDLNLLYAKLCLNYSTAAEEILWLQSQELSRAMSTKGKDLLNTLMLLLRKYFSTVTDHPHFVFQTLLNEGGPVLSAMASNMFQTKYPEIAYLECVNKQMQQGAVLARFQCSSPVACFDVSPQLDYMVCECRDGTIQLWSLRSGKLLWIRPVKVEKHYIHPTDAIRVSLPSSAVAPFDRPVKEEKSYGISPSRKAVSSFYRSVVFHPTKEVVLPGVLSHSYDFNGDLKPLFPRSTCSFTVCSVSGDKASMLTDCHHHARCIILWSLENGLEIARTTRNEEVLSFAWSRDRKLLAISHLSGRIAIVDVRDGFKTLGLTSLQSVCGMIKFSPDSRSLLCHHLSPDCHEGSTFHLNIKIVEQLSRRVDVLEKPHVTWKFESRSEGGFLLGDPLSCVLKDDFGVVVLSTQSDFVLNKHNALRSDDDRVDMLNGKGQQQTENEVAYTIFRQIEFSLSGETIYVVSSRDRTTLTAWNVSRSELIAEKKVDAFSCGCLLPVKGGVLMTIKMCTSALMFTSTLQMWNFELSKCVRRWTNICSVIGAIPRSEERVACTTEEGKAIILDTTSGAILSTIQIGRATKFLACSSKFQILTWSKDGLLRFSDRKITLWKNQLPPCKFGRFSPAETFVIIYSDLRGGVGIYVLDVVSGKTLHVLSRNAFTFGCEFVSDEECVVTSKVTPEQCLVQVFNVKSGDLQSTLPERGVYCLAISPCKRLVAIQSNSRYGYELIHVRLPGDEDSRKSKRTLNPGKHIKVQDGEQEECSCVLEHKLNQECSYVLEDDDLPRARNFAFQLKDDDHLNKLVSYALDHDELYLLFSYALDYDQLDQVFSCALEHHKFDQVFSYALRHHKIDQVFSYALKHDKLGQAFSYALKYDILGQVFFYALKYDKVDQVLSYAEKHDKFDQVLSYPLEHDKLDQVLSYAEEHDKLDQVFSYAVEHDEFGQVFFYALDHDKFDQLRRLLWISHNDGNVVVVVDDDDE